LKNKSTAAQGWFTVHANAGPNTKWQPILHHTCGNDHLDGNTPFSAGAERQDVVNAVTQEQVEFASKIEEA